MPLLADFEIMRFSEFAQNPKLEDIEHGTELTRLFAPDAVVAIGGGSVIDMAKLINLLAAQQADCATIIEGKAPIQRSGKPLFALPTTAGTGSEMTHFAVAYIQHAKYSVAHPSMLPTMALIDPALTYRMPPKLTAVTGLDALCQAIESFWAVGATEESRRYAEEAISLILPSLSVAVTAPNPEVREAMARGAMLAGKAINISKTTAPHALSYALTSHHGVPHGHAVALTLGKCVLANAGAKAEQIIHPEGERFHQLTMRRLLELFGVESAEQCDRSLRSLLTDIGLEATLAEVGVNTPEDLVRLVSSVNTERLNNHPVKFSPEALHHLLSTC